MRPRRSDLVCVVAPQNQGWILDAICHEVADRAAGEAVVHVDGGRLPPARVYFFSHYLLFLRHATDRRVRRARSMLWFTHPSWAAHEQRHVIEGLRSADVVVSTASIHADALVAAGLDPDRVEVVVPGADPDRFRPLERARRGEPVVGFCSAHHPRKRPEVVTGLVMSMPHCRFRLMGRGWREAGALDAVLDAPNFEYLEADYDEYPAFYDSIDVLVSPSELEGGPIPLIEAMMAGVVPVATDTGFARDLIVDGFNGYICPVDARLEDFAKLVDRAAALDADVRSTVEHLTWDRYARSVLSLAGIEVRA